MNRFHEVLRMERICVGANDARLLDNVNLNVHAGEIVGLCGLEDSGVRELIDCLSGKRTDYTGMIRKDEVPFKPGSQLQAIRSGVSVISEQSGLIGEFTALENLELLPNQRWKKHSRVFDEKCRTLITELCPEINPDIPVKKLIGYDCVLIEMIRAILGGADIIILDSILAGFPDYGLERLRPIFEMMEEKGIGIIIVGTELRLFRLYADRLFILRKGMNAGCVRCEEMDDSEVLAMVSAGLPTIPNEENLTKRNSIPVSDAFLELQKIKIGSVLKGLDLRVSRGEILGVLNLNKNTSRYFIEALEGRLAFDSGVILCGGSDVTNMSIADRQKAGLYIAAGTGRVFPKLSLEENLAILVVSRFSRFGICRGEPELQYEIRETLEMLWPEQLARMIPEKGHIGERMLMLCRAAVAGANALVVRNISQGMDVRAKMWLRDALLKLKNKGCAIMLIDFDVDFLAESCDRLCIVSEGICTAEVLPDDLSIRELRRRYAKQLIHL